MIIVLDEIPQWISDSDTPFNLDVNSVENRRYLSSSFDALQWKNICTLLVAGLPRVLTSLTDR